MEISLIADTVTVAASTTAHGLGFAKFLLHRRDLISNNYISVIEQSSGGIVQISAVIFPIDAVAPPPVKPNSYKTLRLPLLRKMRRTRRRSFSGDSEDGEDCGGFGDGGDGDGDGPFLGGGGGGGGRGWNSDRFGGGDWDESWSSPSSGPAFDFVYEVICWIALSNCVHFAFKKVVQIVVDGIGDAEREKIPMRLTSMC